MRTVESFIPEIQKFADAHFPDLQPLKIYKLPTYAGLELMSHGFTSWLDDNMLLAVGDEPQIFPGYLHRELSKFARTVATRKGAANVQSANS